MTEQHTAPHDWDMEMIVRPVGFVQSEIKDVTLAADREGLSMQGHSEERIREARAIKDMVSRIVVNPALTDILQGLDDFSHALVLYWPHLQPPESRKLTSAHPMGRKDIDKVGIFATCSPGRPNPILVTAVQVVGVEGNVLTVKGLEAVDGSPVLDIKPYNGHYMVVEGLKLSDWMEKLQQQLDG